MPASPNTDRRNVLTWSGGSAFTLGLVGKAGAQTAAALTSQGSRSPSAEPRPDIHMEQTKHKMKHTFVDNIVMLAELTVKPEGLDDFLQYTVSNLRLSRSYPGNLAFDILFNEAEPTRVTFYEVWASSAAQREYMAWRVQAGDLTKLLSFLAGEPRFTALRSIAI